MSDKVLTQKFLIDRFKPKGVQTDIGAKSGFLDYCRTTSFKHLPKSFIISLMMTMTMTTWIKELRLSLRS
jgi:hypothetical protein